MKRIETADAPAAIGSYSQGVRAGDMLFVSGQIPVDPSTGIVVSGGIKEQTVLVIANIAAVLSAGGLTLQNVVRADVYITDMNSFAEMNEVYAAKFTADIKPSRVTVEVSRLPKDVLIEIAVTAYCGG